MKTTLKNLAVRNWYYKDKYSELKFDKRSIELKHAACLLEEKGLLEKELDFSVPQQSKLFRIKFTEHNDSEEAVISMVKAEMHKESYHPASFEELVIFLYQNREKYLSNDEKVLWEIGTSKKIIALGGNGYEFQGTKIAPFYMVRHECLGSSVDRDLSHHPIPELGILYFGEKDKEKYWRNQYYLSDSFKDKEQLFLGIAH